MAMHKRQTTRFQPKPAPSAAPVGVSMRTDVVFDSGGTACRGWYYAPQGATRPAPAVVMSHGITAIKEQHLERYAERFAGEGFAVLVFDYRHLGSSDGTPRGRVNPRLQH